jgi:hypothetical protein
VGRVTHCGDAAADWRGALPSTRVDEEESVSVEEELEAMTAEPQQVIQFQSCPAREFLRHQRQQNASSFCLVFCGFIRSGAGE